MKHLSQSLLLLIFSFSLTAQKEMRFTKRGFLKEQYPGLQLTQTGQKPATINVSNKTSSATPGCFLDSTIHSNWDNVALTYTDNTKEIFSYNQLGQANIKMNYFWFPQPYSFWYNTGKDSMIYDAQGNLISQISYFPISTNPTSWVKTYNQVYAFNAYNDIILEMEQQWDSTSNSWNTSHQTSFTYNTANLLTLEITQDLNQSTNQLQNVWKETSTYDASNNLIGGLAYTWDTVGNTWQNAQKGTCNATGNRILDFTVQLWDTANNSWQNGFKGFYSYDSQNNGTQELYQQWDDVTNQWVNSENYIYTYDGNNNMTSEMDQIWNTSTNSWKNTYKTIYIFDNLNNQLSGESLTWNTTTNNWDIKNNKDTYFNDCKTVGIKKETPLIPFITIYPNPANSFLNIQTEQEFNTIRVLGINGQILLVSENTEMLNISMLEKGIYFIQLLDKNKAILQTQKFVKE